MEAAAILWQRSIKECNMRYTCILSDGDSKTFQHLMSLNIYGKGKSQNANESLHSVIWSHCPKESFQSKKRLEIAVVTAVSEFNFGSLFTLKHVHQNASLLSMQISGRCDEITVDHTLEAFPQSKVTRIQVSGSRRSSCRKMPAYDFVVTEIAAEDLGYVWRNNILYKHCGYITSPCLKSRNNGLF
ncbi:hypothetical protein TNCV_3110471 [Trichonephila clavipes]|nr:hypothetical protein TNCV_3110471 [Trichonephila clavipes]